MTVSTHGSNKKNKVRLIVQLSIIFCLKNNQNLVLFRLTKSLLKTLWRFYCMAELTVLIQIALLVVLYVIRVISVAALKCFFNTLKRAVARFSAECLIREAYIIQFMNIIRSLHHHAQRSHHTERIYIHPNLKKRNFSKENTFLHVLWYNWAGASENVIHQNQEFISVESFYTLLHFDQYNLFFTLLDMGKLYFARYFLKTKTKIANEDWHNLFETTLPTSYDF